MNEPLFTGNFPRKLFPAERKFLDWLLPETIPAYLAYKKKIDEYAVIGDGRRGKGNLVLGKEHDIADNTSPLADVFAYGVIETSEGNIACTIREEIGNQIDIEIVNLTHEEVMTEFEESRRWTYSLWQVGEDCPQCQKTPRIITVSTQSDEYVTLAICPNDKRLWVCENATLVKRIIPVTNYYNELMFHKKIRDPKIALDTKRLFWELGSFTDEELTYAFVTYNKIHTKVNITGRVPTVETKPTFLQKFKRIFS